MIAEPSVEPSVDEGEETFGQVQRVQWRGDSSQARADEVAREEPLEIRVGGVSLAVVMRTPGHDLELTRGFLVTERIAPSPAAIAAVHHCTTVTAPEAEDNVVIATLTADTEVDLGKLRRNMYASSSCGICGKATIESALAHAPPIADEVSVPAATLYELPETLAPHQEVFHRTGGLHAAGLFRADGSLLAMREDVGRHNALDKVVGWAALEGALPLTRTVLLVSGRVSYEIVQKALAARIPIIAAVSAPSSLAVDLAERGGITLAAFLRGPSLSVYTHPGRIRG